jgi:hypothetical protein
MLSFTATRSTQPLPPPTPCGPIPSHGPMATTRRQQASPTRPASTTWSPTPSTPTRPTPPSRAFCRPSTPSRRRSGLPCSTSPPAAAPAITGCSTRCSPPPTCRIGIHSHRLSPCSIPTSTATAQPSSSATPFPCRMKARMPAGCSSASASRCWSDDRFIRVRMACRARRGASACGWPAGPRQRRLFFNAQAQEDRRGGRPCGEVRRVFHDRVASGQPVAQAVAKFHDTSRGHQP